MRYRIRRLEQNTSIWNTESILLLIACFFVFLFPTSINGVIVKNMYMVRNGLGGLIAIFMIVKNGVQKKSFVWTLALVMWLTLLTVTTSVFCQPNDFRVAFASISGFLPTVLIWCVSLKERTVSKKFAFWVLDISSVLVCLWGWALVANNALALRFTQMFYSQLKETMFDNMITIRGKPVMSFGTHSMSAFFIMYLFFYHCVVIKEKKDNVFHYIVMVLLFLLEIPLSSNTAMLSMGIMLGLLIWARNTRATRIITLVAVAVGLLYFYSTGFVSEWTGKILHGTNSDHHGFTARYASGIYDGNLRMVTQYVGVGFLRSASNVFRMNDSGVIYLFTQGNLPAVVMSYVLMYRFFKRNMTKYVFISFVMFFVWEFISASTFISVKMVFAHIMTIYLINSIVEKEEASSVEAIG